MDNEVSEEAVDRLYQKLDRAAEKTGYHLNPDSELTRELVRGLLVNKQRYGYMACPCRLASGDRSEDRDIICPCDYRDADLEEYGNCYCALYVSRDIVEGKKEAQSIPERRPPKEERVQPTLSSSATPSTDLPVPVWRCRVCGYLCAREGPPGECPICGATKERFERFM